MSKSKRELSADERVLWRRVADSVKARDRIASARQQGEKKTPARAVAPKPRAGAPKPSAPKIDPAPADRGAEKRVRRGRVEIDGTLDLHGHTQATGRRALARFVAASFARGDRAIIIVTGLGRLGEGVLKKRLPEWLAESDLRPFVSGFSNAHRSHGGAGAYYVFLKPNRALRAD